MKLDGRTTDIKQDLMQVLGIDAQTNALMEILEDTVNEEVLNDRISKYNLQRYVKSSNAYKRLYAINKIISNGKGIKFVPDENSVDKAVENTIRWFTDNFARKYILNEIETEVDKTIQERQEKYIEEIRLSVIRNQKGPENAKTLKKYAQLEVMDSRKKMQSIQNILRPQLFSEIVGQDNAINSLLSKIASPYPQHVILYGPPGVGKTTAARIALDEAKRFRYAPFEKDAKFVEVDGATLRWDPREITNPLLGSVHDPIYQGSKRDLAETGIPEPKPGLVTEAHGGVLFIDEIGELDEMLQNKLLKVLEDKRVEFSSSYYDPDDKNIPKYIKYLFEKGAPADFILVGATTREPEEINPALRSRCSEVYFEPLSSDDIEKIVLNAAKKLRIQLDDEVPCLISKYTIEGRKAVNILADAYGYILYNKRNSKKTKIEVSKADIEKIISINRLIPIEDTKAPDSFEVGHIFGLGVCGYLGSAIEIEAAVFKTEKKGNGSIRFNDTAGSMAKDSVFNAASVIRRITNKDIYNYDVHVNVIGGGNIDGPSAGAAITLCIISALLNKPIRQNIAVTGEISLTGKIKPVGGIHEKIYGARRKGIKLVFIPIENAKEIPEGIEDIEVKPVSTMEELMKYTFELE